MHNPVNTAISFVLLILLVGGSFYYVHATDPLKPYLGLAGREVTPAIAQELGLEEPRGLLVFIVDPGSPADRAGLRGGDQIVQIEGTQIVLGGDVITSIDDMQIRGEDDAQAILAEKTIGDSVKFTVFRDNATKDVNVVVGGR
jgi:serine protease Do